MRIDLHTHTTATAHHSSWTPDALVAAARSHGLGAIAATDHNTLASLTALRAAAQGSGLVAINGVELDSGWRTAPHEPIRLWHTLVYGFHADDPGLRQLCAAVSQRNHADATALQAQLRRAGMRLGGLEALGRPANVADVAIALARENDLPDRLPGERDEAAGMRAVLACDGYHPVTVAEVIDVAHRAGGIAVLAHPGRDSGVAAIPARRADVAALAALGLDGIEVFYPSHTDAQRTALLQWAEELGLLVSGGSDSHHPHQPLAAWDHPALAPLLRRLVPR
ncbi:MAG: PHP domain-containing protein [Chloroflexi bacterium]|nr:PHP domain-containing protein [Chloroflexota bacterium]